MIHNDLVEPLEDGLLRRRVPTNEAQQWIVDRYADGLTRIINLRDKLCLDTGEQPAGGLRPAVLTQCQYSFWQLWEIVQNGTTLMIRNYYGGCLDIAVGGNAGHKPGVGVVLYGVCGTNLVWEQWEPIPVRERLYAFRNKTSQLCLEPTR